MGINATKNNQFTVSCTLVNADNTMQTGATVAYSLRNSADAEQSSGNFTESGGGIYYVNLTLAVDGDFRLYITSAGYPSVSEDIEVLEGSEKHQLASDSMVIGTVDNATFTPTTSVFEADDITEATADHYNGRVIIWTSGALKDQAAIIDDYELANSKGKFTTKGLMTEAPANNDTFIVV